MGTKRGRRRAIPAPPPLSFALGEVHDDQVRRSSGCCGQFRSCSSPASWCSSRCDRPPIRSRRSPATLGSTREALEEYKHSLGLDRSLPMQYWTWLKVVRDVRLGPVALVSPRRRGLTSQRALVNTLVLGTFAFIITISVGVTVGIISALRQYSKFDNLATGASFFGPVDPAVLVRPDPPAVLRGDPHEVVPPARAVLTGRRALPTGSRGLRPVVAGQVHDPSGDRRRRAGHRDLQPVHAVLDARGDELRLHAHRAVEGHQREASDRAPRLPQRPASRSSPTPRSTSEPSSAVSSSPKRSSSTRAWVASS